MNQLDNLPEWAAKLSIAIFSADFLTMLLMNTFRLYTRWLPVVFFVTLVVIMLWIFRSGMIRPSRQSYISSKERLILVFLALSVGLLISGTRLSYILEGHLNHLVGPIVYDDTWHFQEINSLVNSARYPAHYNLIPNRYFSLYYAPWILIAALYRAVPVNGFTVKAAFFAGCTIYNVLLVLTFLFLGLARAHNRKHLYWAIYLLGFWAGGSSLFALRHPLQDNNWWMQHFGFHIQFSSYAVVSIWSIHHLTAVAALLLCWHILDTAENHKWGTIVCCSLLICYSFYASIFVIIGALPIGLIAIGFSPRKDLKHIAQIIGLSVVMAWPMLWIYLGKSSHARFLFPFVTHTHLKFMHFSRLSSVSGGMWFGLCVFLIILFLNFLPHFVALGFYGKKLALQNRVLVGFVIAFLISTYFVGFTEGNNYATRSSILPLFIFGWICAGLLPAIRLSAVLVLGLFVGGFGSLQEGVWAYRQTLNSIHALPAGKFDQAILAINRDRRISQLPLDKMAAITEAQPDSVYFIEKFVPGGKVHLVNADFELECLGPRGPWQWEAIPGKSSPLGR